LNLDALILRALRESNSVSGAELADRARVSRAAIWARIEELRSLGYEIAATPHQGYRLVSAPDLLHSDDLRARLKPDAVVGRDIQVFSETASTNDIIDRLARDGAGEGVVVFAESQTRGRGRLGRTWISPAGQGLWFSILLRPQIRPQAATQVTVAAATAVSRAIARFIGLKVQIKWPNDLLIDGKKVAGILTELSAEVDRINSVTLGIGIDVNIGPDELPGELSGIATSLRIATGQKIDRPGLACSVLHELDLEYRRMLDGQFMKIAEEWEEQCVTLGRNVSVNYGNRRILGRAEALDDEGALMVRTAHGQLERVTGGDVLLEK
jgi:BirA family biotin operon repressor/biotin-[acetyl-CoA-carboxylase] ligase